MGERSDGQSHIPQKRQHGIDAPVSRQNESTFNYQVDLVEPDLSSHRVGSWHIIVWRAEFIASRVVNGTQGEGGSKFATIHPV